MRVLGVASVGLLGQLCGAANVQWQNIAIGGGGYVPGTFFHPKSPDMWIKTDVGGAYR
jgi:xyloglucan-specific exo-beta-1,4-glucanase